MLNINCGFFHTPLFYSLFKKTLNGQYTIQKDYSFELFDRTTEKIDDTFELFFHESMLFYHSYELIGKESIQMHDSFRRFRDQSMLIYGKTTLINGTTTLIND